MPKYVLMFVASDDWYDKQSCHTANPQHAAEASYRFLSRHFASG